MCLYLKYKLEHTHLLRNQYKTSIYSEVDKVRT